MIQLKQQVPFHFEQEHRAFFEIIPLLGGYKNLQAIIVVVVGSAPKEKKPALRSDTGRTSATGMEDTHVHPQKKGPQ